MIARLHRLAIGAFAGLLAWGPAGRAADDPAVVQLPPMIVLESSKAPPWLYAKTGHREILSRCSASTTREFVEAEHRIRHLLKALVPDSFFVKMDVPQVTVIERQEGRTANDAVMKDVMSSGPGRAAPADARPGAPGAVRPQFLPNLRLDDRDMTALFVYLDDAQFDGSRVTFTPQYLRFMLERRTPMLPAWLIEGTIALFEQQDVAQTPVTLRAVVWASAAETRALQRDDERPRILLPTIDLFSFQVRPGEHPDSDRIQRWRAQVALFCRWAVDPRHPGAREAFWQFVQRTSEGLTDEAAFAACFGFGYSDLRDRLSDYLPIAVSDSLRIDAGDLPKFERPDVKPATPEQIARLRGEWERVVIPYVRTRHPQYLERYVYQARRTLRRAYDDGERGAGLMASLGLCEVDAGDDDAARPFLERAVEGNVVRPRAYFELARLRYRERIGEKPPAAGLAVAEITPIVEVLRRGLTQAPALPESYALLANAWLISADAPPAGDLAALVAGARLYSWRPQLAYRVILLLIRHREFEAASALTTLGWERAADQALRQRFAVVQQHLATVGK